MFRRPSAVCVRPELDDDDLHRTLTDIRPSHQLHGLGADRSRQAWLPAADLLRATGQDWDRRVHRSFAIASVLPPSVAERWVTSVPGDPDALVVQACVRAVRARSGSRPAVDQAQRDCVRAARTYPEDPTPLIALLGLMRSRGAPIRHASPVWAEIIARAPGNRAAHHEVLGYLSPRGQGSVADMTIFARRAASGAPEGSPLVLLPLAARAEHFAHRMGAGGQAALGAGLIWSDPGAAYDIDVALLRWFRAPAVPHAEMMADLNILAFSLIAARRLEEADTVFRRIGPHMTMHPWEALPNPKAAFLYWMSNTRR
ncbi:hypothetical protein [Streptomyces sp. NPDC004726]